ncbi:MAG: hypothetical protein BWX47_01880 [candidate division Hyd24-12 bacterium ADurb.Bin004]|nr:MAG: hypothetical protein BWX47_01880 [candidate division Hyd24-12 bacterium ADurb.Bin004]
MFSRMARACPICPSVRQRRSTAGSGEYERVILASVITESLPESGLYEKGEIETDPS